MKAIFFFSFFSASIQSNTQLLWAAYILEKHPFSPFFERMSVLLCTAPIKRYIFSLRMPQRRVRHTIPVSQVQRKVIFSLNWNTLGVSVESVPRSKPKVTAETAADSGALGQAIKEGFALAGPPIGPCPSTLILEVPQKDSVETPRPFWLFFLLLTLHFFWPVHMSTTETIISRVSPTTDYI